MQHGNWIPRAKVDQKNTPKGSLQRKHTPVTPATTLMTLCSNLWFGCQQSLPARVSGVDAAQYLLPRSSVIPGFRGPEAILTVDCERQPRWRLAKLVTRVE
jgi:hypothetical protein